jgi:hypothetical protein
MATYADTYKKMRWYVERDRLGLVTLNTSARVIPDNAYLNIPIGSTVRVYGAKIAQHFDTDTNTLPEIPEQFHEAIIYKAIANGYETPPTQDLSAAQYFNAKYMDIVKQAKKWKQLGRQGGYAQIVGQDF